MLDVHGCAGPERVARTDTWSISENPTLQIHIQTFFIFAGWQHTRLELSERCNHAQPTRPAPEWRVEQVDRVALECNPP